jgi:polysaccharide deacetylase family protein (PEP-CTERM system associated)
MSKFSMTIDWEDFGQLLCRDHYGLITKPVEKIIDRQTNIILELLDKHHVKGTFFILGMLAKHRPDLVKKIESLGHEIALHGNLHQNLQQLSYEKARQDIQDANSLVSDIIGKPVYGYRAPYFSITKTNINYLEILSELGLIYDSSIFPVKLNRYGIDNFPSQDIHLELKNKTNIVELPITCSSALGKLIPVAGGGYMRLFPEMLISSLIKKQINKYNSVMLYMHPYEFDSAPINCTTNYPTDAVYSKLKVKLINFRWNIFRQSITSKLDSLLQKNEFITCYERAIEAKKQEVVKIESLVI